MAGNAINRGEAAAAIARAENAMSQVPREINDMITKAVTLSQTVASQQASTMYGQYRTLFTSFRDLGKGVIDSFSGADKLHGQMINLVNAAKGTVGEMATLSYMDYGSVSTQEPESNELVVGVNDYNKAADDVKSLLTAFETVNDSFTSAVNAYQDLYDIAGNSKNDAVCQKAHEAANKVRELANKFHESTEGFANEFVNYVNRTQEYSADINKQIDSLVNSMSTMVSDMKFKIPDAY